MAKVKGSTAFNDAFNSNEESGELQNLPNVSTNTAMRNPQSSSTLVVRMVKVETIVSKSRMQTRQLVFNPDKFAEDLELLKSVQEHGVIEPLVVRKLNKDILNPQFSLMSGERRLSAAMNLKLPEVPVRIMDVDEDGADLKTVAENTGRRDLDSFETAMVIDNLLKSHPDWKFSDIEKATGWSYNKIKRAHHAYYDSCPELRGLMASGLPANRVIELQPVFKSTPNDLHQALAERVFHLSNEDTQRLSAYMKQNPEADPFSFIDATSSAEPVQDDGFEQESFLEETPVAPQKQNKAKSPSKDETYPYDDNVIDLISNVTGVNKDQVSVVLEAAQAEGCNNKNVVLATCLFIHNGGDIESSLMLTLMAMENKKSAKLIKQFVGMQIQLGNSIETIDKSDPKIGEFIRVLFGKGGR